MVGGDRDCYIIDCDCRRRWPLGVGCKFKRVFLSLQLINK